MGAQKKFKDDLLALFEQKIPNLIAEAISSTIAKFTGCETKYGKLYFDASPSKAEITVAGLLRMKGSDRSVNLILGFPKDLFLSIYASAMHSEVETLTEAEGDLAGEILNVSFGIIDEKLTAMGHRFDSSFPKVFIQDKLQAVLEAVSATALVIPMETSGQKYYLMLFDAACWDDQWEYTPRN